MNTVKGLWTHINTKYPAITQFFVFFVVSNGVTLLQMALMPFLRSIFSVTALVDIPFEVFPVGQNLDGSQYYIFNYAAGGITVVGTGGGLAYFLAVQISLAIAQIINFFAQRNITFKSNSTIWKAAFWYVLAYIAITLVAGAAQGLYKAPIYRFFMSAWRGAGETIADVITMIINAAISFWVFFPIFKVIFKNKNK
jgi:putative flippase GtrA